MGLLSNNEFYNQLKPLFDKAIDKGSVFYILKRVSKAKLKIPVKEGEKPYLCLLRVTVKDKTISTHLDYDQVDPFLTKYNALLRSSMPTLKRKPKVKDRKKKEAKELEKEREKEEENKATN